MKTTTLTAARLRELLHYDPETGLFRWKLTSRGKIRAGQIVGSVRADGYRQIMLDGVNYLAHRLAWLYVHGDWPADEIDHRKGVRAGDMMANLRESSRTHNNENRRLANRNNQTGVLGVCRNRGRFMAQIMTDRKKHHLGRFDTAELAHAAYIEAKRRLHPAGTL